MKENRQIVRMGQYFGLFSLGAAAGSLLGLLFAPASGRSTRKRIGSQIRQTKKLLLKKADLLREAAVDKFGDTREWLVQRVPNGNGRHGTHRRAVHHA